MSQKVTASMPEGLDLTQPYTISFAALSPTTGAAVSGVVISNAQIHVADLSNSEPELLQSGPFMLVPGPNT